MVRLACRGIQVLESRILPLAGLCFAVSLPLASRAAETQSAAEFFPESCVVYAELPDPVGFLDLAMNHPVRQQLESLDGIQDAYETPQFLQVKAAVAVIEAQLGETWPNLIKSAAAGGIAIAIDAPTQGAAIVITAQDEETPKKILETFAQLARADSLANNKPDPIETKEYRGLTVYRVDQSRVVILGKSILATNKADLGQRMVDMHLDKAKDTLATSDMYQQARKLAGDNASMWGYVDMAALRQAGVAKELFAGRADNPALELIAGGVLANLQKSPLATFAVTLTDQRFSVNMAAPHDPSWVGEEREYFFGKGGQGVAPPLLHVDGELLSLSTYRDISQMWLRAGDLFDDNVNDQLAQADSNLATLFSGKDFGEEILGAVGPEIQLIVSRQEFADGDAQPALKLPAFALALTLKDAETMRPEFRRTFQSLIGFLNVIGAMNGQPQLDLESEKAGDQHLITATYLPEKDADTSRLPINFNFSPSVGFVQDRMVVSSTKALADDLLQRVAEGDAKPRARTNTLARADLAALRQILDDNRGQLVAQNMLSEGNTKEEAEQEIGTLLNILGISQHASFQFTAHDGALRLALDLTFTPHQPSPAP